MKRSKLGFWQLALLCLMLTYLGAQRVHETGHWAVLQAFRREPVMGFTGLVQLWDKRPLNPNGWTIYTDPIDGEQGWLRLGSLPQSPGEWISLLAAGQVAQLIAVMAGLLIARYGKSQLARETGLALSLVNSLGQALYHAKSLLLGSGADERYLSFYLGIPKESITIPLLLIYILAMAWALRQIKGWRERGRRLVAVMAGFIPLGPVLMLSDRVIRNQMGVDNPWFRPVLGFSLPVLIADVIVLMGLWLLWRKWRATSTAT